MQRPLTATAILAAILAVLAGKLCSAIMLDAVGTGSDGRGGVTADEHHAEVATSDVRPHPALLHAVAAHLVSKKKKSRSWIAAWNREQWKDPEQADALVEHLETQYKYKPWRLAKRMLSAYTASPKRRLKLMKNATNALGRPSSSPYFLWTSKGRMALMLKDGKFDPDQPPAAYGKHWDLAEYDDQLHCWVVDIGKLHAALLAKLTAEGVDERTLAELDANNFCKDGDWANGITAFPEPKFDLVAGWVLEYFPELHESITLMTFHKTYGATAPPYIQIKQHLICFFFKGAEGPGSIIVNEEFADPSGKKLRDDLPPSVFTDEVITVEVHAGKTDKFKNGLSGKFTYLGKRLYVIPMIPRAVKKFDPSAKEYDPENAARAFGNAHPRIS